VIDLGRNSKSKISTVTGCPTLGEDGVVELSPPQEKAASVRKKINEVPVSLHILTPPG
jgi:hypothetical protein